MKGIGGNIAAAIQVYTTTQNEIGEQVQDWVTVHTAKGWLDLSGGEARYGTYHAKIQESTHLFIADYVRLDERVTAESSRMVINGRPYDITLIDDPMEMHQQLEIFLKYTGGQ